jgi:hypothetical protein
MRRPRHPVRPGHQQRGVEARERDQNWPGTLMVVGIFAAIGSVFTVAAWTLIGPGTLLRIFLLLCFVGNLLPYLRSGLRLGMARLEWFLFNLLAVGPLITSLLLWTNYLVHGPVTVTEHAVAKVQVLGTVIEYHFQDGHLAAFPFARSFFRDQGLVTGDMVRITEATGILGYGIVLHKEPYSSADLP